MCCGMGIEEEGDGDAEAVTQRGQAGGGEQHTLKGRDARCVVLDKPPQGLRRLGHLELSGELRERVDRTVPNQSESGTHPHSESVGLLGLTHTVSQQDSIGLTHTVGLLGLTHTVSQ